ncbi:Hypothetical protein PHPALM_9424 [Phytophthora palmivora]|uniref:Uncharacterized protein n=1 Tax=Phytophthora palmivora TaxID=4796 RepID=A0A2P4Y7B8_9STRA|nr:Hypothetical protein PHPALM_9424 [Phytophthora palmivora]
MNSNLLFQQYHHVWVNGEDKMSRVIGWANPALLKILHYGNIAVLLDDTLGCVPDKFAHRVVVMVFDRDFLHTLVPHNYGTYWNRLQFVSNACGEAVMIKEIVAKWVNTLPPKV